VRVVMLSSLGEQCGVAAYTRALFGELTPWARVELAPYPSLEGRRRRALAARRVAAHDLAHVQYHPDYCGCWRSPLRLLRFRAFLRQTRVPRVVTAHDVFLPLAKRPLARRGSRAFAHNVAVRPALNHTRLGRSLRGGFLTAADHVIVHSERARECLQQLGVSSERLSVLYPGIPELPPAGGYSLRRARGWQERQLLTVFGFVTREKGYEALLDAVTRMPSRVVVAIAGGARTVDDERYARALGDRIAAGPLRERVIITGYLDDVGVAAVLRESDAIVLPYRPTGQSGTSYALSLALAAERPVVASDTPYFREIAERHGAIDVYGPGALGAALERALERGGREPAEARAFREEWRWKRVAQRTHEIYESVLSGARGSHAP
jgi:glycosyltransferase involved in cell wall biosynthesis